MERLNIQSIENNNCEWLTFWYRANKYDQYGSMNQYGYTKNDMIKHFKHRMYGKC